MRIPLTITIACLLLLFTSATRAQDTSLPLTVVVPLAPGGATDIFARLLANEIAKQTGQTVIVENRVGAGGMIGTRYVSRSEPNGRKLLFVTDLVTVAPSLMKNPDFNPTTELTAVTAAANGVYALLVNAELPIKTIGEYVEYSKKNPGKLLYGSSGIGSTPHLLSSYFNSTAGIKTTHVPYTGNGPALTALMANQIQALWNDASQSIEVAKDGKARIIAVGGRKRSALLPDVPTVAESGYPDFEAAIKFGVYTAANTPTLIVDNLSKMVSEALKSDGVSQRIESFGYELTAKGSSQLSVDTANDLKKWNEIITAAGIERQ